jgi:hypothetical protein
MTKRRESDRPATYQFRVKGSFDEAWLAYWFDGFVVKQQAGGATTMTGAVADEAALHSVLAKVRDLGMELLYLERMES